MSAASVLPASQPWRHQRRGGKRSESGSSSISHGRSAPRSVSRHFPCWRLHRAKHAVSVLEHGKRCLFRLFPAESMWRAACSSPIPESPEGAGTDAWVPGKRFVLVAEIFLLVVGNLGWMEIACINASQKTLSSALLTKTHPPASQSAAKAYLGFSPRQRGGGVPHSTFFFSFFLFFFFPHEKRVALDTLIRGRRYLRSCGRSAGTRPMQGQGPSVLGTGSSSCGRWLGSMREKKKGLAKLILGRRELFTSVGGSASRSL